ncbi:ShlB/FhaC/HecB family hemolysin secretion/activation protein [Pelagibacterium sediminicola]|uniref:ShlB/FhaC/HecB family hemolysin secretion/activation protein n=1 Tax=Pelagibacterium sediminicola TaxID=2248761 RepID=UPI000E30EDF2|nr:ShlB/FhaC/HecB family hemolysin secretion/activation protein [Pelagibacterium sediminicola]
MHERLFLRVLACAGMWVFAPLVLAQDAGSLLREQQLREVPQQEQLPEREDEPQAPSGVAKDERGATIILRGVRFTGHAELLPVEERTRLLEGAIDERLGINGLHALADEVTATLQREGMLLARAVLPPQDITEGILTIEIVEGRLANTAFQRAGDVRASEERLATIAASHIAVNAVRKEDLEEALLRMNDHPGVTARAKLKPGETAGTSDLVVDVTQTPRFSARVSSDNFGDPATGVVQGNVEVTLTDLSGLGDLTNLSIAASQGQQFVSTAFSMPVGPSGLTAEANYSFLTYRNIDDVGGALELEGYAHSAGLGLDYALARSRDFNLEISGSVNGKVLVDDSIFGRLADKRVISGTLGLSGDARDSLFGGGLSFFSLGWTYGGLDLSREASSLTADEAGLQTQGAFHRVNASLARLQDLPGDFSLFGRIYGQWANKNLDSSQDFSLGGPHGVRGWPVGEGRGDMGVLGTAELRYDAPIPEDYGDLQLAAFLDGGHVWMNAGSNGVPNANACGCNAYGLASAGMSARWARENLSFSVSYAHSLGSNPGRDVTDDAGGNQQFWLTGAVRF